MQQATPDILFSLFKMTFILRGSFNQEFNFIVKIKKNVYSSEILKKFTFSDSVQSHD
jgi:hypothetical protein